MNNKKGQLEDINPVYIVFGLVAGAVAWFVAGRVPDTPFWIKAGAALGSVVLIYLYLSMTE